MTDTAEVFSENRRILIRLPDGIEPKASRFNVRYDKGSGQMTLIPVDERTAAEREEAWNSWRALAAEVSEAEREQFDAAIRSGRLCPKCGQ